MNTKQKRIAVNVGGGYVPGLNAVITGVVLAASELGWEVVGICDGFEGLLFPENYPDGGLIPLIPQLIENIDLAGAILGTAVRNDPFHVRTINSDNLVEEVDKSEQLLETLRDNQIDGVISIVGNRGLSILYKLHRKGLKSICIPRSVENDMATTMLSFGFNSALSFTTEMLDRARQAAHSARKIGVVEVLGEQAGWLALQSAIAVGADAVLIPEIPYDLPKIAAKLQQKCKSGRSHGLVVVAEGAIPLDNQPSANVAYSLKASLSPLATDNQGSYVIQKSGQAAQTVALGLQRLIDEETYPLVLSSWVKGGTLTAVDRQLAVCYGAGAVRAINSDKNGVMVAFQPPDLEFVPLAETINKVRTVPANSELIEIARAIGICLGA